MQIKYSLTEMSVSYVLQVQVGWFELLILKNYVKNSIAFLRSVRIKCNERVLILLHFIICELQDCSYLQIVDWKTISSAVLFCPVDSLLKMANNTLKHGAVRGISLNIN